MIRFNHAFSREGDATSAPKPPWSTVSIHALARRATKVLFESVGELWFQSTPRAEGDHRVRYARPGEVQVSTNALARRATFLPLDAPPARFQSRPRAEGDTVGCRRCAPRSISITPSRGRPRKCFTGQAEERFQSALARGDDRSRAHGLARPRFQSTPSRRGGRLVKWSPDAGFKVPITRPRARRRQPRNHRGHRGSITPSRRRLVPFGCHGASRRFNPALARATAIRSAIATTASFSIRPRARGRPFAVGQTNRQGLGFNPRPPRGGRRVSPNLWPMAARRFNPRPRAEATASSGRRRSAPVSIRPRAGGQPVASSRRLRSACSIHALARRHTIPAPAPEAKEFQSALAQEATALPLRRRWLPFNPRPRAEGTLRRFGRSTP